jgi:hypothetical protein
MMLGEIIIITYSHRSLYALVVGRTTGSTKAVGSPSSAVVKFFFYKFIFGTAYRIPYFVICRNVWCYSWIVGRRSGFPNYCSEAVQPSVFIKIVQYIISSISLWDNIAFKNSLLLPQFRNSFQPNFLILKTKGGLWDHLAACVCTYSSPYCY